MWALKTRPFRSVGRRHADVRRTIVVSVQNSRATSAKKFFSAQHEQRSGVARVDREPAVHWHGQCISSSVSQASGRVSGTTSCD